MTLTHLLCSALLVCSLPTFAQDQQLGTAQIPGDSSSVLTKSDASPSPAEPWRITSNPPADVSSDSADHIRVDQYRLDQGAVDRLINQSKPRTLVMDGPLDADTTCLTMRSYVVARDSKDSDSTHPVSYSTCQRASRYHVKTAEGHPLP